MGPGSPYRVLQRGDAVAQGHDQPARGVVEGEVGVQALDPRELVQLVPGEPQPAPGVGAGLQQPEGHHAADHVRVEPPRAGERVQVQARRRVHQADERVSHQRLLGSNVAVLASWSQSLRSSSEIRSGTTIRTSAYRSPGVPGGFGRPRPRRRSRLPLDVPAGTRTVAEPPGVSRGTLPPSTASQGATGRSTWTSRPSTRYLGWSAMRTRRYRSPASAPSDPCPP